MLTGEALGQAIATAIRLKIAAGGAASKADIARHFGIKPPSLSDWTKRGTITKTRLPELWNYFSDVVGFEHWGLTEQSISRPFRWTTPASRLTVAAPGTLEDWPFARISAAHIRALSPSQLRRLEDALELLLAGVAIKE